MADSFIRIAESTSGKQLDAESLTISGSTRYRERIQVAGAGSTQIADVVASEPGLTADGLVARILGSLDNRFRANVRTTRGRSFSASGNQTVLTPTTGKRLLVHWIGMSASTSNSAGVRAIIKFTSASTDAKYDWDLGVPGQFSHWETLRGGIDERLVLNLSGAQTVRVNCTFEEST